MAYLHAIETATPEHAISQDDARLLSEHLGDFTDEQKRTTEAIYRKSGVETRRCVILDRSDGPIESRQSFYRPADAGGGEFGPGMRDRMRMYERFAPPLSQESATAAVAASRYDASDFGQLVSISCTGFAAPGWDIELVRDVLHPGVKRSHIGFMGCHASFNGLRAASALADTAEQPVLMTSLELCSVHHRYPWVPETTVSNALFGDGAGSVVLSPESDGAIARYVGSHTLLQPDTESDMSWRLSDHGFVMTLSIEVPKIIGRKLRPWLDDWLAEHDLKVADVAGWAVHPGGPRILSIAANTLEIERDAVDDSYAVLRENGNMSSATVLFILQRMAGRVKGPVVALGFGPGLTFEAMLIEML